MVEQNKPYTIFDLTDQVDDLLMDMGMLERYANQLEELGYATLPLRSILEKLQRIKDMKGEDQKKW